MVGLKPRLPEPQAAAFALGLQYDIDQAPFCGQCWARHGVGGGAGVHVQYM